MKVDAYNGINSYLSELSGTSIKTVEDIVTYNVENRGSEGAAPGDHPAFPSGQVRKGSSSSHFFTEDSRITSLRLLNPRGKWIKPITKLGAIFKISHVEKALMPL